MTHTQKVDCFHDNTENEEDDCIVDTEWSKLKASHTKEGYREGYSAGQEAVLQDAFNRGFAHQVQLETSAAFYKGILRALKTFSERSAASKTPPKVRLSAGDDLRIASLLEELSNMSRRNDSSKEDKTDDDSETLTVSQTPEGSITSDQKPHCNPGGCVCHSADSDGETMYDRTSEAKCCNKGTFQYCSQHSKLKEVVGNCMTLLKELGLEEMLHLHVAQL